MIDLDPFQQNGTWIVSDGRDIFLTIYGLRD